ncbi:Carotenoid cleavage dioxygenase 8 like B, chloroplastic [Dendrobium catenatum]|uniref:Carotenoid cleavage dioxygenase 8 like B, chloroplastic n=1 Tax=Dendrobium catenatum TaxID=906689 RepID=A0A2I0WUQ9_9ASPA|nr:Carotenoid cleavage dioxygenase 8 like B, chloroplastic [Dendrobium catenatum]
MATLLINCNTALMASRAKPKKGHSSVRAATDKLSKAVTVEKTEFRKAGKLAAWTSIRQERWEGELQLQGEIPLWLNGTYLRNGPGLWHIADYYFRHLFDGYATLVRLHFHHGRLVASHRQIESEAYKAAKKNNRLCYREFSEAPKPDGFFSYVGGLAQLFSGASLTDNANTGIVRLGDGRVVCLTETVKGSIQIDPETLGTIGRFVYTDGLGGLIHSAHPMVTETELVTLLPDLVRAGYTVVRGLGKKEKWEKDEIQFWATSSFFRLSEQLRNLFILRELERGEERGPSKKRREEKEARIINKEETPPRPPLNFHLAAYRRRSSARISSNARVLPGRRLTSDFYPTPDLYSSPYFYPMSDFYLMLESYLATN